MSSLLVVIVQADAGLPQILRISVVRGGQIIYDIMSEGLVSALCPEMFMELAVWLSRHCHEEIIFLPTPIDVSAFSSIEAVRNVNDRSRGLNMYETLMAIVTLHNNRFQRKFIVEENQESIRLGDIGYTGENVYFIKASSRDSDNPTIFKFRGLRVVSDDEKPFILASDIDQHRQIAMVFDFDTLYEKYMSPDEKVILIKVPVTLVLK